MVENTENGKQAAALAAVDLVQEGMTVGLGTGSTSAFFIDALVSRCNTGLNISCVATSEASAAQAREGGITVLDLNEVSVIHLTIDGADEMDRDRRMIKGGGGALLREKIVATASEEMIAIIDEGKVVEQLGSFGLPLEVVPFGHTHTLRTLEKLNLHPSLRLKGTAPVITDNGNYTVDLQFPSLISNPEQLHSQLLQVPGVVETGLFLAIADRVVVGSNNGTVTIWDTK